MSCIYSALKPLHVVSKLPGLAPCSGGKSGTTIPDITGKTSFRFSVLYNHMMFAYMLGWFIFDMTLEAIYRYPKLSSRNIIPIIIRSCTFAGICLSTLILCHRRSLRVFCSKISLVDKVLLGEKASSAYATTKLIVIIKILVVFVSACMITLCDISGRRIYFTSVVRMSGCIIGGSIATLMLVQYLIFVWILKSRLAKLNTQLSAMLISNFEEESLETFVSVLEHSSKANSTDTVLFGSKSENLKMLDPLFFPVRKIRNQLFHHDRQHIRALRQIHGVLCDVIQMINSNYGIPILLIISYAFVSFVMFTFLAMDSRHVDSMADCDDETSCGGVIMNFCISCTCMIKVMGVVMSYHTTSSEAAYTSTVVQKLISQMPVRADSLAELQLFSQQLWNTDFSFTAFGFFAINLNLLCSVAGTATTYIVVLLQLK
ncbi:hypothetical protein B7P43_G06516 [Cryptotermes secundus]|uniref:Gustatory receptor n=1 Tax=Cryptotermes secundus TaxID=105785 RepID=A0A2J7Q4I2_9NEOP|nr:hypothetical protein B7P43_G06516 [Cryptotermes secundus]